MAFDPAIVGYVAAALLVATFFMRVPVRLRQLAILTSIVMLAYAVWTNDIELAVVSALLIPINAWRLYELESLTKKVRTALSGDLSMDWLTPFMVERKFAAGEFIFRKGDPQTDVFYIVRGTVRLPEIELTVGPGELLGEMAIFSPTHDRSLSACCIDDVEVLHMPTEAVLRLYYRNPQFGIYLVRLITRRLLQDTHLLGSMINERTGQLERLRAITDVDEVTGLANRRAFESRLHMEWTRGLRVPAPISLIVIEIDDARHRHWNDDLLAQIAISLSSCVSRSADFVARHDNEFVVILPNTTEQGARAISDVMRAGLALLSLPAAGIDPGDLHAFTGVATRTPERDFTAESLLSDAYQDLHRRRSEPAAQRVKAGASAAADTST